MKPNVKKTIRIGHIIKRLRVAKKITTRGFAKQSGIPKGDIWSIETDKLKPTIGFLHIIANKLDVTISDLLFEVLQETYSVSANEVELFKKAKPLINRLFELWINDFDKRETG